MLPSKTWAISLACIATTPIAPSAYAQVQIEQSYFSIGALASYSIAGAHEAFGVGAEAAYTAFLHNAPAAGVGFFGQAELYTDASVRTVLGGHMALMGLGFEGGFVFRSGAPNNNILPMFGWHAALFVSVGVVSFAVRGSLPFTDIESTNGYGPELGFALTVKWPIRVYGPPLMAFGHGRPLRKYKIRNRVISCGKSVTTQSIPTMAWIATT